MKIAPDLKKKIAFRYEKFQKSGFIWRQNFNFSEKMGALGDSTQFCEKNIWGLGRDYKKYGVFG